MKILFLDTAHSSLIDSLRNQGHECVEYYSGDLTDAGHSNSSFHGIVIRSRVRIDKTFLDPFTSLRFIARVGAGMENIDVHYAESKGIHCLSAADGNKNAVGEHALGMLLMLANNLHKADREVRLGRWIREENRGWEIEGKTIGIIGYGKMGEAFHRLLQGFSSTVILHDKYKEGMKEDQLQRIFKEADIVSLHLPLTEETVYYANEKFLSSFHKPVVLINTARGKNVNTKDLLQAIRSGKVKGACLDVLEFESGSFENFTIAGNEVLQELFASDKVVLSPHIGGWTHESNEKMARILLEKIQALG